MLLKENEELSGRVTALESVVRSLLSALSQYEPAAEAYADNADAWEIIMKTMPAADMMPEDTVPLEDDYDGDDDIMDDYSEEEE
jgi:hypothetical protein